MLRYDPRLKGRARSLRANLTDAEQRLWARLRRKQILGLQFYRQKPLGRYIADFACHAHRLVIEVDGSQHGERSTADEERTRGIEAHGYRVLRYWNNDVLRKIDGVLEDILSAITKAARDLGDPHP